MTATLPYKIRFVTLSSRSIYNYVGPWDWNDNEIRRAKRAYLYDRMVTWFDELEQSILLDGIKNPISIVSGKLRLNDWLSLPEYARKNQLTCNLLGGSRLFIAQKHDLPVPCIVSDFTDRFSNCPEVYQATDIKKLFVNPPSRIIYSKHGLDLRTIPTKIVDK